MHNKDRNSLNFAVKLSTTEKSAMKISDTVEKSLCSDDKYLNFLRQVFKMKV